MNYETFEHEADIGIRGFGSSIGEAFENAALAMYSVMVKIEAIEPLEQKEIVRIGARWRTASCGMVERPVVVVGHRADGVLQVRSEDRGNIAYG